MEDTDAKYHFSLGNVVYLGHLPKTALENISNKHLRPAGLTKNLCQDVPRTRRRVRNILSAPLEEIREVCIISLSVLGVTITGNAWY